jgi:hypothetical protein
MPGAVLVNVHVKAQFILSMNAFTNASATGATIALP